MKLVSIQQVYEVSRKIVQETKNSRLPNRLYDNDIAVLETGFHFLIKKLYELDTDEEKQEITE